MMHRLPTFLTALCLAALPLTTAAEQQKDRLNLANLHEGESRGNIPERWTCVIDSAEQAVTIVQLSAITSISKQTYLLEGTQRILEVTIDTTGNNSIRFYCLSSERAARVQERTANARELVDRHSGGASRLPSKKYPEATHSHNIEYQLSSPEQVQRIYESATHAWVKNLPSTLLIRN